MNDEHGGPEGTLSTVLARLQALEDERAIRDVVASYGICADTCRDEQWLDLFTDDGTQDVSTGAVATTAGTYARPRRWEGHEQLAAFIGDPEGHHRPEAYGRVMHLTDANAVVRIEGDDAVATTYGLYLRRDGDRVVLEDAASMRWTLRRVDGRWRIVERRRRGVGDDGYVENCDETAPAPRWAGERPG
jgi:hypothetical protein